MADVFEPIEAAVAPRLARILAFSAILAGGILGGVIGWALVRLQYSGHASWPDALGAMIGAVTSALGVAIVATLVMRAMSEWRTIQHGVNPRNGKPLTR